MTQSQAQQSMVFRQQDKQSADSMLQRLKQVTKQRTLLDSAKNSLSKQSALEKLKSMQK